MDIRPLQTWFLAICLGRERRFTQVILQQEYLFFGLIFEVFYSL